MLDSSSHGNAAGFSLLRMLSERGTSRVYLARAPEGDLCALKVTNPGDPAAAEARLKLLEKIQPLTTAPGLLPIRAFGRTQNGWVWQCYPLADNMPGLPAPTSAEGLNLYTPVTLRVHCIERGPTSAKVALEWGERLASALATLHQGGIVHRDVKPGNIVFVEGKPCLGDYELASGPGWKPAFIGTEGYRPMEGTNDVGGDLFALGKTLYEAWTGHDRLEYPSLTREVLESPEWAELGSHLNTFILKACHNDPRQRYWTAAEMVSDAAAIRSGRWQPSRSKWAGRSVALGVAGVGIVALFLLDLGGKPRLINVAFGTTSRPGGVQYERKVGQAAEGYTTNDFWNFYTEYIGQGMFKTFDTLANLRLANGKRTATTLTIANAAGCWDCGSLDPMYHHFVYSLNESNVTVTVTNLAKGKYDVLAYAFAGNFELRVGDVDYGTRSCFDPEKSKVPQWTEGIHYVRFTNVVVSDPSKTLVLTVKKNPLDLTLISGLQILERRR